MIKVSNVLVGVMLLCAAAACQKPEKETPSGLKYTVVKSGDGKEGKKGEILVFDFQLKDSKDSVWHESYVDGIPARMEIRDTSEVRNEDGVTQMLNMLCKGDSVKTSMSVPEFFTKLVRRPVPPGIDSTGSVTYTIKVDNIMPVEEYVTWREEQVSIRDEGQIQKYLADNNLKAEKDTSGFYYIIHKTTGSPKPTPEKCVEVKYSGKFLKTGLEFDKNERIGFSLNEVITGWKWSIPLLGKGDSATFFIPSKLGYGPQGYPGAIPPDAVLMFDIALLDFNNEVDPATRTCK